MASGTVTVNILGDANSLKSALGESESALSSFAAKAQSVGERATSIGRSMTFGVTLPLIGLGKVAFDELEQSAKASAQTEAAIRSTGGAANVAAEQVDRMATSLLKKTGIDDEVVKGGENILLTFRGIRNEAGKGNDIFNQATKATLDLSVAFGKDMTSSAILVGKALQDPIAGVGALRRVGVQLDDQQQAAIKTFVQSGDIMSAQKVILKELTTEVGGSADAYGKSLAGQASLAKEELKNAGAEILASTAPALKTLAGFALDAARGFASLPEPVKALGVGLAVVVAISGPLAYTFGAISKAVSGVISILQSAASASETFALKAMYAKDAIAAHAVQIGAWGAVVGLAAGAIYGLSIALGDNSVEIQANIAQIREATNAQLTQWILKLRETTDELGTNNLMHSAFQSVLSQDVVEAQRFIDSLDAQGIKTGWYTKQLQDYVANEARANGERDNAKNRVDALRDSVQNLPTGWTTNINVNTEQGHAALDALWAKIDRITSNTWHTHIVVDGGP